MGRLSNLQLLFGAGAEHNNNTSAEGPQTPSGFTRTSSELKEKGWDGTFFAELYFVPWLGAGYAFQAGSKVTFDERVTFTANPRFALTIDAAFDPTMHHFFGTVRFPPRSRLQVFVQPGATIWKASSITVQRVLDGTTALEERRIDLDREGVSPYVAGGVDWFFSRRVGTRVKYSYDRLKDSGNGDDDRGSDEKYHTIGIFFVVNAWPLR